MTQFQFDLICKIIEQGAPVLADELRGALEAFVQSFNNLVAENEQLKTKLDSAHIVDTDTEKTSE